MGSHDSPCNTGLSLGLTFDHSYAGSVDHRRLNSSRSNHEEGFVASPSLRFDHVIPPLSLGGPAADLATDGCNPHPPPPLTAAMVVAGDDTYRHHQIGSNISPGSTSSYSNNNKRYYNSPGIEDKEFGGEEEVNCNNKVVSSRMISDEEEEAEASPRKKLRLTKQQSAVLEDSFREHSTLNPTQKQTLATQLNLRPRQVEVWFQNRRARTKLKQTETDCELLKKCCETLTEENKRLHREIQELKSLNLVSDSPPPPHYMQMPAATLSLCPSCADGNSAPNSNYNTSLNSINGSPGNGSRKSAFPSLNNGSDTKQQPPGLSFNITTRSSAAC